ncbi:hypothetical protein E05_45630 [Plautia stali symbiont]|nr:hypothetical protein E05_45630 [Plautia stali symbiont]
MGFALAVTPPQAGNLGGGFMLLRNAAGRTIAIDFREMAPARASRDTFLDKQGNAETQIISYHSLLIWRPARREP